MKSAKKLLEEAIADAQKTWPDATVMVNLMMYQDNTPGFTAVVSRYIKDSWDKVQVLYGSVRSPSPSVALLSLKHDSLYRTRKEQG